MAKTHEERRLAIMIELGRRSRDSSKKYIDRLTPVMSILFQEARGDAVELMGLLKAVLQHAAAVAYDSVGTPTDLQFRTGEDFAGAAGAIWEDLCLQAEQTLKVLSAQGDAPSKILDALASKVNAAPSDPTRRPDVVPRTPQGLDRPERPVSLEDVLSRINSLGVPGGN